MKKMVFVRVFPALLAAILMGACTVGPAYVRPTVEIPPAFKEAGEWKSAEPSDAMPRGSWWKLYGDPALDALEEQAATANQSVQGALAQLHQARTLLQEAQAARWPTVTANASSSRAQSNTANGPSVATTDNLTLQASWEADLWGRVGHSIESGTDTVAASTADLANVRLSVQATLAQDYFQLRVSDLQQKLLNDTVQAYQNALRLTQNQYDYGIVTRVTVVQAQTQLEITRAQAIDVGVQRATLEHAIAVLIGQPPSDFSLPVEHKPLTIPSIPVAVPSMLLERRPDIAGAERRVAAANAQIGVAKAAFFPTLTLTGNGGFRSEHLSQWLTVANRFWALGPNLAATLLDGGLRSAKTENAIATFEATVATYRQTVLTAFQEVEDNLAAWSTLAREASVQEQAVVAARESVRLTINQYKLGTVSYLNVVTTQATLLSAENTLNTLLGRRLTASVALLKALGGGWDLNQDTIPVKPQQPTVD